MHDIYFYINLTVHVWMSTVDMLMSSDIERNSLFIIAFICCMINLLNF